MIDLVFMGVLWVVLTVLWLGLGVVAMIVSDFHAERALSLLGGRSGWRKGVILIAWPITVITVLLLQLNPRYRGSNHAIIDYPDPFP